MNYTLSDLTKEKNSKRAFWKAAKKLLPILAPEKKNFFLALAAILINSGLTLLAPILVARTIDDYILTKQFGGVLVFSAIIVLMYLGAFLANYFQTRMMGGVGQRTLFRLRSVIFDKLQELPVAFFNQNKAGDLISRINNDTDKLNQFFSQSLVQLMGSLFVMAGAAVVLVVLNPRLGLAALAPAVFLLIFTRAISPWVKKRNTANLQAVGGMSAEVQESLDNFKVVAAFNRRDYFREHFHEANVTNFSAALHAGIANNVFTPVYTFFSNVAQLIVLSYGIYLIVEGDFTVGLLISFIAYVNNFYNPLRQIAGIYSTLQTALAGWDRISQILELQSNLLVVAPEENEKSLSHPSLLQFQDVSFRYGDGKDVLHHISFSLEKEKTYALVGPTGGGKTTTASLMARLYDASEGKVLLNGRDIRSFEAAERTQKIGFILQDPFVFSGTVRENILYGNPKYADSSSEQMKEVLEQAGLQKLLVRFENGLDTPVVTVGSGMSLGQKQLIAFIRAVLRAPELLILDEATANIDTVTESFLSEILEKLPKETTRVIIAHRLNTIKNADEIFFVDAGTVTRAGSFEHALDMLLTGYRGS
ncbi:MAG TPA: ABC transporter ATP-binding protein [Candidatus Paceibacterota bacterium]|nr:ABC transporter ATP-binding protein [Candidatus Paceibacterota bacterium]